MFAPGDDRAVDGRVCLLVDRRFRLGNDELVVTRPRPSTAVAARLRNGGPAAPPERRSEDELECRDDWQEDALRIKEIFPVAASRG